MGPLSLEVAIPDEDPVVVVFNAWVQSVGKSRCVLDAKRRRLIQDRLKEGFSVGDLCDAVTGWHYSPHHRGENDRSTVYNELGLLLRDAGHVERFIEYARQGNGGGRTPGLLDGVHQFLAMVQP